MIRTKSVYEPEGAEDGLRILVTRFWPRGVKKERVDRWFRDLGTSPEVIKAWKAGTIEWKDLRKAYLDGMKAPAAGVALEEAVDYIRKDSGGRGATLLCTCRPDEMCHRQILKELLDKRLKGA